MDGYSLSLFVSLPLAFLWRVAFFRHRWKTGVGRTPQSHGWYRTIRAASNPTSTASSGRLGMSTIERECQYWARLCSKGWTPNTLGPWPLGLSCAGLSKRSDLDLSGQHRRFDLTVEHQRQLLQNACLVFFFFFNSLGRVSKNWFPGYFSGFCSYRIIADTSAVSLTDWLANSQYNMYPWAERLFGTWPTFWANYLPLETAHFAARSHAHVPVYDGV